jgi:hypothetical protein
MMNLKTLLIVATMSLLGAADLCSACRTLTTENVIPFVSKRIHQPRRKCKQFPPVTPLKGWISDFTNAIIDDFAVSARDSSNEILHECIVNYRKGLVGNF